jgi:valyl-tRNA synthetase
MPFITEEIWQQIPRSKDVSGDSIMMQPWPHINHALISEKAETEMKHVIDIVTAIRNMRSAWNIEPKLEVKALINTNEKKDEKLFFDNAEFIKRLSKLSGLEAGKVKKPENAAVAVVCNLEIYIPLKGVIDFDKETERLKKEEARISGEIKSITMRLKDKNFTGKAPKEIVEKQRIRKADLELQVKKLKENLKNIG